jgi:hypothetical protein
MRWRRDWGRRRETIGGGFGGRLRRVLVDCEVLFVVGHGEEDGICGVVRQVGRFWRVPDAMPSRGIRLL